jgi:hypothetical protein
MTVKVDAGKKIWYIFRGSDTILTLIKISQLFFINKLNFFYEKIVPLWCNFAKFFDIFINFIN